MNFKFIQIIILLHIISTCSYAQINSFEKTISNKKTVYQTNSFETDEKIFENQSSDLIKKLKADLILGSKIELDFIKDCINDSIILEKNKYLFIEFIVNQNGEVLSCCLVDYGNKLTLIDTQVNCILSKAMKIKFTFSKTPMEIGYFFIKVIKQFID